MTTVEKIIAKIRELAAASPENKYHPLSIDTPTCMYNIGKCDNGTEGCIVGQALIGLGLLNKYDLILYFFHEGELYNDSMAVIELCKKLNIKLSIIEKEWLWKVQNLQDMKHSWANAIHSADAHISIIYPNQE